jgi:hypothetical protein
MGHYDALTLLSLVGGSGTIFFGLWYVWSRAYRPGGRNRPRW